MTKKVLIAAIALLSLTVRAAPGQTVQEMIGNCRAPDGDPGRMYCIGQASGVMALMMANSKDPVAWRACSTGFISNGQAIQIFLNWADRNPTRWQIPSPLGFAIAVREAYPCK